jgi:hypothetical protein
LILDIESKLDLEKPTNRKESESGIVYLMAFGELTPNKAISMSIIVGNTGVITLQSVGRCCSVCILVGLMSS